MWLKNIGLIFLSWLLYLPLAAQPSAIDSIAASYRNWLTGEEADYTRPELRERYNRFLVSGNGARDLSAYNFAAPGAAWDFSRSVDQNEYRALVENKLIRLVFLYQLKGPSTTPNPAYHNIALRDTILMLFRYMQARGISDTTDFAYHVIPATEEVITSAHGVALRSSAYATSVFLMKNELLASGDFAHHMAALHALTKFIDSGFVHFRFSYPGYNADVIRASLQQRFCYILAQHDTERSRNGNMRFFKRYTDNALQLAYGWSDCIKPDFMTYHHRGPYANTYGADALQQAAIICRMLSGSTYALSASAQSNLRQALMAYRRFCIDFTMPRGLAGRFPDNTGYLDILRPALAYLYVSDTITHAAAGMEFKRLWAISPAANLRLQRANTVSINLIHSLGGMNDMRFTLDAASPGSAVSPDGHYSFPYAGLSVHRYNHALVSVKGMSKHIWHYENSATENLFGQYTSAGAIELLHAGIPVTQETNGLSLKGWDWTHIPGTTTAQLPFSSMAASTMRMFNGKDMLAHATLDNNGVFAMDYRDPNAATPTTALKTVFFFRDKILCLGSGIRDSNGTNPIHTTLFQTSFSSGNTSLVNADTIRGNSFSASQTGGPFLATDAVGNGFIVPASPYNTQEIHLQRSRQFTPDNSNTHIDTGDFILAYINHGSAPRAASYQCGIQLQGGGSTADFLSNFSHYFSVLRQDSLAHIVRHIPDSVLCYVIFDTAVIPAQGRLRRSGKPAVLMTQETDGGNQLRISLTNPNLGLLDPGEAYDHYNQISAAAQLYRIPQTDVVSITLRGLWTADSSNPNVITWPGDSTTEVQFRTRNGLTEQTILSRSVPLSGPAISYFQAQQDHCTTVLDWQMPDAINYTQIAVLRSTDGSYWRTIALLPPTAVTYEDEDTGPALYRLELKRPNGQPAYSSVIQGRQEPCPPPLLRLYPNPTTRLVQLNTDTDLSLADIQVRNAFGIRVPVTVHYQNRQVIVDLGQLPAGLYCIEAAGNSYKVMKQ